MRTEFSSIVLERCSQYERTRRALRAAVAAVVAGEALAQLAVAGSGLSEAREERVVEREAAGLVFVPSGLERHGSAGRVLVMEEEGAHL